MKYHTSIRDSGFLGLSTGKYLTFWNISNYLPVNTT